MELHRRCSRLITAGAVLALALAACGGGDRADDDPTKRGVADDDIALAANFRLTDFPPGWERTPGGIRPPDSPADKRLEECMGRPPAAQLRTSLANSDNFGTGQVTRANSSVQVMRTEAFAQDDFAALRSDKAIGCLGERLDAELATQTPPGGQPFTRRSLERIDPPRMADDTLGFRMVVAAPSIGPTATLVVDQIFVRKGRIEISTSFVEPERPFAAELQERLLRKLVERAG